MCAWSPLTPILLLSSPLPQWPLGNISSPECSLSGNDVGNDGQEGASLGLPSVEVY